MSTSRSSLDTAKRWVNALSAPLGFAQTSSATPQGFIVRGGRGETGSRQSLADIAGIGGRQDALMKLPRLLTHGLAASYEEKRAWRTSLPGEASTMGFLALDPEEQTGRAFARAHGGLEEETSVVAQDVAGLARLSGLAYSAAYIAEHEAWALLLRAASAARATYGSWEAYGRGFVFGSWFSAGYMDARVLAAEKAVAELLAEPTSAWRSLPWELDLTPLDVLTRDPGDPGTELLPLGVRVVVDCPECLTPTLLSDASMTATCHFCSAAIDHVTARAWQLATRIGDGIELDADEEAAELANHKRHPVQQRDVIDHPRTRISYTKAKLACVCGALIEDADLRACVAERTTATLTCKCGRSIPVATAPDPLRAADFRARYLVGCPLRIGSPDGLLTILFSQG